MSRLFTFLLSGMLLFGVSVCVKAQDGSVEKNSENSSVELENIEIFASYSNNAFKEPVMVSSIKQKQIESKISNLEFPEVLKSVPAMYVSRKGGGYGDSRVALRGFSSENVGVTINGIPINGMENGSIYWSNWAGLADVTSAMQVQRGIGLSNRSLPSYGGIINILTLGAKAEKGGSVFYGLGNDGYQKTALTFSTGLINGWNFTFSGSHTKGDGYVVATNFEAWSYFAELSKIINDQHTLNLTAFGAPQWHNSGGVKKKISEYDKSKDGIRMNTDYGFLNEDIVSTSQYGYNEYHKPQIALNHYWTANDNSSLMTSVYVSIGTGGGQRVYGLNAKTPDGLTDFDKIMADNKASDKGSTGYLTMSTNSHDWYGLLSTYSTEFAKDLTLRAGFDGRYYVGYHYDELTNLLAGAYYLEPVDNHLAYRTGGDQLQVGDRINYDYLSRILQYGVFGELVYEKPVFKTFLTFAISDYSYLRKDPGKYGEYSDQTKYPVSMQKTAWETFIPVTIKAGFNYNISQNHRVFINGGYITRAPKFENVFVDNVPLTDLEMEKVMTAEAGYAYHSSKLDVSLNAYYTRWNDKSTSYLDKQNNLKFLIPNVDAVHKGVELEVAYRPMRTLTVGGFFSLNNWHWASNPSVTVVNFVSNDEVEYLNYNAFLDGVKVGDAPQTSAGINLDWEIFKGAKVGADFNYYACMYANFYPDARINASYQGNTWEMPDFGIVDLRAQYNFKIGSLDAVVYGNVNNLFNKEYISEAQDGANHDRETATVWYGLGRTWTTGLKLIF